MFAKKIIFNISASNLPVNIKIRTLSGRIILNATITQNNSIIYVCYTEFKLAISAQYNNQTIIQYYNLTNCKCQVFNVCFRFNNTFIIPTFNFILLDKNYNLPVPSAILKLTKSP